MAKISLYLKGTKRERGKHLNLERLSVGASKSDIDQSISVSSIIVTSDEDTYISPRLYLEFSLEEAKELIDGIQKHIEWLKESDV